MKRNGGLMPMYLGVLLASVLLLSGCGSRILKTDYQWAPYEKGDVLTYENEKGNLFNLYVLSVRKARSHASRSFRTEPSLLVYASSWEEARMTRKDPPPVLMQFTRSSLSSPAVIQVNLDDFRFASRFVQSDPVSDAFLLGKETLTDVRMLKNERPPASDMDQLQATRAWWSKRRGLVAFELSNGLRYTLKSKESNP